MTAGPQDTSVGVPSGGGQWALLKSSESAKFLLEEQEDRESGLQREATDPHDSCWREILRGEGQQKPAGEKPRCPPEEFTVRPKKSQDQE